MKSKIKISLLILTCFILMGCPAGHFYDYEYIGNSKKENYGYSRIEFNKETGIKIKCGFFVNFIDKTRGLSTFIEFENESNIDKTDISVNSSTYGDFIYVSELKERTTSDFNSDLTYKILIESGSERKILKRIKNDTINIKIKGEKIFEFIKTE